MKRQTRLSGGIQFENFFFLNFRAHKKLSGIQVYSHIIMAYIKCLKTSWLDSFQSIYKSHHITKGLCVRPANFIRVHMEIASSFIL